MGGNSALIYVHLLVPKMGLPSKPRIRLDKDLYAKFHEGILSIANIDQLKDKLETIGVKIEEESDTKVVFALEKPIEKQQLETIRSSRREKLKRINEIIAVRVVYPEILILERRIALKMRSLCSEAQELDREISLIKMARIAWGDVVKLGEMQRGYGGTPFEVLMQVFRDNETLEMHLQLLVDVDVLSVDETMQIIELLQDANTLIAAEAKKIK